MSYDPSPSRVIREGFRWFWALVITGILLSAGLVLVILATNKLWFFADTQNVRHQIQIQQIQASGSAAVNRNSFNYNQGYADALTGAWQAMHSDMEALGQEPPEAQAQTKAAVLGDGQTVCYDYYQVNQAIIPISPSIVTWAKANCDGTDVSMTSSLRK